MTRGLDFTRLTLCGALDFAVLLEREARDRYLTLARSLEALGDVAVAGFFTHMARMEEEHRAELEARRRALFGDAPLEVDAGLVIRLLEGPHTDEEAMGLTLRDALDLALRAETRARDFFLAVVDDVAEPEVKRLFAELAEEEVEHQRLVRAALAELAQV